MKKFFICLAIHAAFIAQVMPQLPGLANRESFHMYQSTNQSDPPANDVLVDTAMKINMESQLYDFQAVGFDGTNYLIVSSHLLLNEEAYLVGVRVNGDGEVIGPGKFLISDKVKRWEDISVAFGDSVFLVVWNNNDNIHGSRIDMEGNVLDPDGITICSEENAQEFPVVASDGTDFLVCWIDDSGDNSVYGTLISSEGEILTPEGIDISVSGNLSYPRDLIDLAAGPSNYLVTWVNYRSGYEVICGARVSFTGELLDNIGFEILNTESSADHIAVASDGNQFLVVGQVDDQFRGVRVTGEGEVLDPGGVELAESPGATEIDLTFGGDRYLLNWRYYINAYYNDHSKGAFIDQNCQVIIPGGFSLDSSTTSDRQHFNNCYNGESFFITCSTDPGILVNWLSPEGILALEEGLNLGHYCNNQSGARIASDGNGYLAVWTDEWSPSGASTIRGMRLDADGKPIDSESFFISEGPFPPEVEFNGGHYLVCWFKNPSLYGCRISPEGEILDSPPIVIKPGPNVHFHSGISTNQQEWVIVWSDTWAGGGDIFATRISGEGEVLDPNGIRITSQSQGSYPDVAFDGVNYLVAWTDYRSGLNGESDIYAARVTQQGQVLETNGFKVQGQDYGVVRYDNPSLAFNGSSYLIAYNSNAYDSLTMRGKLVSPAGAILKEVPISLLNITKGPPNVYFTGSDFLVAWDEASDIMGTRISPDGEMVTHFKLVDLARTQFSADLATGHNGKLILCYSGFTEFYEGGSVFAYRIWSRSVDFTSIPSEPGITSLKVYPNPSNGVFKVKWNMTEESPANISLYDLSGHKIVSFETGELAFGEHSIIFNPGKLSKGIYLLGLRTTKGEAFTKVILVSTD